MKQAKTNALRMLDSMQISYSTKEYPDDVALSAIEVANLLEESIDAVYKTLVTVSNTKHYYVFCIPGHEHLDLKKCAKAAKEKSIAMIPQKELLPLTGYIHGGCSPVGMKKPFPTFIQEDVILQERVFVSAGRIGLQMQLAVEDLIEVTHATVCDLIKID